MFVPRTGRGNYFQLYESVDIILDPVPYVGHTTTMDALWMGVPVVTLVGETCVSRGGAALLAQIGLPELIARDAASYRAAAEGLASDRGRLEELHRTLRDRMMKSFLCDAVGFTRDFEEAYRSMWRTWCERRR